MSRQKSPEQRRLEGNPGRRPIKPTPTMRAGVPECPGHLDAVARVEWDRIVPILQEAGLLTVADMAMVALYCSAYSEWVATSLQVEEHGRFAVSAKGIPYQSPCFNAKLAAMTAVKKFADALGLSPESRGKVTVSGTPEQAEGKDRFFKIHGVA